METKDTKTPSLSQTFTLKGYGRPLESFIYDRRKVFNPQWFQGNRKTNQYFEGWYFKNISANEQHCWSFIPGISMVEGDTHAFVQVINGFSGQTWYYRYPAESFSFAQNRFEVCIGKSFFSEKMILLDLDNGQHRFRGELYFEEVTEYPSWWARPGIMGWYRYMPFMECYHGVVSLDHGLRGSLYVNGETMDFNGGRGYIEKDWGSSMPSSWIWMQCNHFDKPGTSFMLSVARIPWIQSTFTGFLGFWLHEGKILSFATYTGARLKLLEYDELHTSLVVKGKKHTFHIMAAKSPEKKARSTGTGNLKAPMLGNMDRIIHESLDSQILLTINDKKGNTVFKGTGRNAGFEMVGDLEELKL